MKLDNESRIMALARMWVYLMDELNDMDDVYCNDDNKDEIESLKNGMDAIEDVIGIIVGADVDIYETWRTDEITLAEK